jgi:hypothetical protein
MHIFKLFTLVMTSVLVLMACSKPLSDSKKTWTKQELRDAVQGLSRAQLKDLLGPPDAASETNWWYNKLPVFDPITEKKTGKVCIVISGRGTAYLYDIYF